MAAASAGRPRGGPACATPCAPECQHNAVALAGSSSPEDSQVLHHSVQRQLRHQLKAAAVQGAIPGRTGAAVPAPGGGVGGATACRQAACVHQPARLGPKLRPTTRLPPGCCVPLGVLQRLRCRGLCVLCVGVPGRGQPPGGRRAGGRAVSCCHSPERIHLQACCPRHQQVWRVGAAAREVRLHAVRDAGGAVRLRAEWIAAHAAHGASDPSHGHPCPRLSRVHHPRMLFAHSPCRGQQRRGAGARSRSLDLHLEQDRRAHCAARSSPVAPHRCGSDPAPVGGGGRPGVPLGHTTLA